jgi:hypothetical protein
MELSIIDFEDTNTFANKISSEKDTEPGQTARWQRLTAFEVSRERAK